VARRGCSRSCHLPFSGFSNGFFRGGEKCGLTAAILEKILENIFCRSSRYCKSLPKNHFDDHSPCAEGVISQNSRTSAVFRPARRFVQPAIGEQPVDRPYREAALGVSPTGRAASRRPLPRAGRNLPPLSAW
jgi:hypothetical protein